MRDDLISRKALLKALETGKDKVYEGKTILEVMQETVKEQPTAFDKEKVIEQLNRCRVYQFQGMLPDGRVCHFSDVVEIVEKGGIG